MLTCVAAANEDEEDSDGEPEIRHRKRARTTVDSEYKPPQKEREHHGVRERRVRRGAESLLYPYACQLTSRKRDTTRGPRVSPLPCTTSSQPQFPSIESKLKRAPAGGPAVC